MGVVKMEQETGKKVKEKRLNFKWIDSNNIQFINNDKEIIGKLERLRVGSWMSWVYFLYEGCYLSAGCSDEVRDAQRTLNFKCKSGAKPEMVYELNKIEVKNEKENQN